MADLPVLLLVILGLIQINVCTSDGSYCPQLGCDGAGTFTQDDFKLPLDKNRTVAWHCSIPKLVRMNYENENYGCVGSPKVIVCPYQKKAFGNVRHIMLNTDTGVEYDTTGYDTLDNVNMPILTKNNEVFATNSTHASLVDPINKRSFITRLPTDNPQGMHSPLYLPDLGFFVVFGNLSESQSIYKISTNGADGSPVLDLVTTFQIQKTDQTCPWLPFTEIAANGNRAYLYAYQKDDITGLVAVDFMSEAPYYKKAWELANEESDGIPAAVHKGKSRKREDNSRNQSDNCTIIPDTNPDFSTFPPADANTQLLATPDKYVVMTTPMTLMVIKDQGDSAGQGAISLFGGHFLSLDTSPAVNGKSPIVWMTGWQQYPPFRILMSAFNYTNGDIGRTANWYVALTEELGVPDVNVTSRITMFKNAMNDSSKVMVFGASVNNTKSDSTFLTKYCTDCKVGMNHVVMAMRTEYKSTADPHIYWMLQVPLPTMEVRGQIIGVSDKLIMYIGVPGGGAADIIALK